MSLTARDNVPSANPINVAFNSYARLTSIMATIVWVGSTVEPSMNPGRKVAVAVLGTISVASNALPPTLRSRFLSWNSTISSLPIVFLPARTSPSAVIATSSVWPDGTVIRAPLSPSNLSPDGVTNSPLHSRQIGRPGYIVLYHHPERQRNRHP